MKKIIPALLILPIMLSCILYSTPPLGETNFPLKQVASIPVDGIIRDIVVGDTWIAVYTYNKIIAIDIDTQKTLWTMDFQVNNYGVGLQMINNTLFTASQDQILLIDKRGQKKEIVLEPIKGPINIIKVATVYPNYVYVVRGPDWTLEVYDIFKNTMLWKIFVGRSFGDVFYDSVNNVAYVATDDSLRAFDNSAGKFLWKLHEGIYPHSTFFEEGILYVSEQTNVENAFRLAAIDAASQNKLWEKDVIRQPNHKGAKRTVIDNVLIFSGYGMIAIDKSNGEKIWESDGVGEEFSTIPVEFDGVIYTMGIASSTVFAISFDDGSLIGTANLESDSPFGGSFESIYSLKDGIIFNTRNLVVIYKTK